MPGSLSPSGSRRSSTESPSQTLLNAGPTSCCTSRPTASPMTARPASAVQAGDTFGFRISGSNSDFNSFLQGTLRVATNVVVNGGFETPVVVPPDGFTTLTGAALPGWDIGGEVQVVNETYWNAAVDGQSLDLGGEFATGAISQTFATVIGQDYDVTFQYSANPESADPDPQVNVLINGVQVGPTFTHARTPRPPTSARAHLGSRHVVSFTADRRDHDTDLRIGRWLPVRASPSMRSRSSPDLRRRRRPSRTSTRRTSSGPIPAPATTHIEGVLGATPIDVVLRSSSSSPTRATTSGQLGGTPDVVGDRQRRRPARPAARTIDADDPVRPGRPRPSSPREVTSPGTSNIGPCIVVTDAERRLDKRRRR